MPKRKPNLIDSNRKLAKAMGVDEGAVRRWRQRRDWPFGAPPWPASEVPAIEQWREKSLAAPTVLTKARTLLVLRQAEKIGAHIKRFDRAHVRRDIARQEIEDYGESVERALLGRKNIDTIMRRIAPHLNKGVRPAARAEVTRRLQAVVTTFRAQLDSIVEPIEPELMEHIR